MSPRPHAHRCAGRIIYEVQLYSCFDMGEVPRSPSKQNWCWLSFLPFIFIFEQCVLGYIASIDSDKVSRQRNKREYSKLSHISLIQLHFFQKGHVLFDALACFQGPFLCQNKYLCNILLYILSQFDPTDAQHPQTGYYSKRINKIYSIYTLFDTPELDMQVIKG